MKFDQLTSEKRQIAQSRQHWWSLENHKSVILGDLIANRPVLNDYLVKMSS